EPPVEPRRPALDQPPDLALARAARHDEERATPGRELDARPPRTLRDADLDVHRVEAIGPAGRRPRPAVQSSTRLTTTQALCPRKPNEFESATRTSAPRDSFGM